MADYIVIDKQAARGFVHEMHHLSWEHIPEDILNLKFKTRYGNEESIRGMFEYAKKRTEAMGRYIELALKAKE